MPGLPAFERFLLDFQILVLAVLAGRLVTTGLYLSYRYFASYIFITLVQCIASLFVPFNTNLYRNVFVAFEILSVCCCTLVLLELYHVVLGDLTGIARVSIRYIRFAVGAAVVISLLLLALESAPTNLTGKLFIFERAVVLSLVIFVLMITGFLLYYPVPLNRNVIVYSVGYAVYFLTKATTLFVRNLGNHWDRPMSAFLLGTAIACLTFWTLALNRKGEVKTMVIGHPWDRSDEERLLAQLRAINASLARAGQK